MAAPEHQATFLEKLDLLPGLISTVGTALYTALTAPFRGESGAHTFRIHLNTAVVRKLLVRFNTRQLQFIGEPFGQVYEKFAKANGFAPEFVTLPSGVKAFWLGNAKQAKYIVVYFHGGGFSLDGEPAHIQFWHSVQKDLEASKIPIAFLFLEYTLVPHGTYPTQISQAVEAVKYVLTDLKRPASEVILGGDSAGGNMALGVLSHLSHPSPDFPELKLPDGDKLKAIVAIAPWVSFDLNWPSEEKNRYKDLVTTHVGALWSGNYLASRPSTYYAEPFNAPADWWKDAKVEQLLAVAGSDEILLDQIDQFIAKYKSINPDTTYVVGQHEVHIAPIINIRFGDNNETEQGKAIKSFLKAKL